RFGDAVGRRGRIQAPGVRGQLVPQPRELTTRVASGGRPDLFHCGLEVDVAIEMPQQLDVAGRVHARGRTRVPALPQPRYFLEEPGLHHRIHAAVDPLVEHVARQLEHERHWTEHAAARLLP